MHDLMRIGAKRSWPNRGSAAAWVRLALLAPTAVALAGTVDERVVKGTATFERHGPLTTIRASDNAIINYRSFDVLAHETVQFVQPDANSRVLNRVLGDGPTSILGNLLANGHVDLVNPAGIYFGNGSYVNVGGLVAAAGSMSDADFLAHRTQLTGLSGPVVNAGTIVGGSVVLAGQQVLNEGTIRAPDGIVAMLAGDEVLVGEAGSHVFVNLGRPKSADSPGVENTGTIEAPAGRSVLAAGDLYALAVANSGTIAAERITLEGAGSGLVRASGTLDASAPSTGARGGKIDVFGQSVALEGAMLDASGSAGGGSIRVGGDVRGQPGVRTATETVVDRQTTLKADALQQGDGGSVVVWSDGDTAFQGTILARALGEEGRGGWAEVSGKEHLALSGHAQLAGAQGEKGRLLLDPGSVTIQDGPDAPPSPVQDVFTDAWVVTQLNTGGADLTISTADSGNQQKPVLTVEAAADVAYASAANLNLIADEAVVVNGRIANSGSGRVTLEAPDVTLNGPLEARASVNAGNLTLGGSDQVGGVEPLETAVNYIDFAKPSGNSLIHELDGVVVVGNSGSGNIELEAGDRIRVAYSDTPSTLDAAGLVLRSAADIQFEGNVSARSLSAHAGTDGSGKVTFDSDVQINADRQEYRAGDGLGGGGSGAEVRFASIDQPWPVFRNSAGSAAPDEFVHWQDASIPDVMLADAGQFGIAAPGVYRIRSDEGVVSIATSGKVEGSALSVWAGQTATLGAPLSLASLEVAGSAIALSAAGTQVTPTVESAGPQTYQGPVSLTAATVLRSTAGGDLSFAGTIDGPASLDLATAGTTRFAAPVGQSTTLASLSTDAAGRTLLNSGVVKTSGDQVYGDALSLGADTTLTAARVQTGSTLDGTAAGAQSLVIQGNARFEGVAGGLVPLESLSVSGGTEHAGDSVTTAGDQHYFGSVLLLRDTRVAGSKVCFDGTVDGETAGGQALRIEGDARFDGPTGAGAALASLWVGGATALSGAAVNVTGAQEFVGAVTLEQDTSLTAGTILFRGPVDRNAPGASALTIETAGAVTFEAAVGGGSDGPLGNLVVDSAGVTRFGGPVQAQSVVTDAAGSTAVGGGAVTTSAAQVYNDPVILNADTTFLGADIAFGGSVNRDAAGAWNLIVDSSSTAAFLAPVGTAADGPLGDLTVRGGGTRTFASELRSARFTSDPGGTTVLGGATVYASGDVNLNSPVTLVSGTANRITGAPSITATSTIDGAGALTLEADGPVRLDGDVGSTTPILSLAVTGARVTLANVSSSGDQIISGVPIELTAGRLDSSAGDIRLNAPGTGANSGLATIYKTTPGDLVISARDFVMGQAEKFVATGGGLSVQASRSAILGDLASMDDIVVNAPAITLLQRTPVAGEADDRGLDFLGDRITLGPGVPTFGGDPAADPLAAFGTTMGAAAVASVPGVVKVSLAGPDPFTPEFVGGVPRDPRVPFPASMSEALGLVEPVSLPQRPEVIVNPAFGSYERLFSRLHLILVELENTLGARNVQAAEALAEIRRSLETIRARHREWAAARRPGDLDEHNPEPFFLNLRSVADVLSMTRELSDSWALKVLLLTQRNTKTMEDRIGPGGWPERHVVVVVTTKARRQDRLEPVSGFFVWHAAEAWYGLRTRTPVASTYFACSARETDPSTELRLGAGDYTFWASRLPGRKDPPEQDFVSFQRVAPPGEQRVQITVVVPPDR